MAERRRHTAAAILRFLIGAILLATALGKLLDIAGFSRVLGTYQAFGRAALLPIAIVVAVAELALAVWLFSGRRPFAAAAWAFGIHLLYAAWSAAAMLRGLRLANCGCFGVFWQRPLGWSTVAEDLAVAGVCAALLALSPRSRTA